MGLSRFGTCWLSGGFTGISLTTTPKAFTSWNHRQDGPGVIASSDGKLTIQVPGYYWGAVNLSFNGQAGVIYYAQIREDGAANDFISSVEGIASGGRVNLSLFVGGHPDKDSTLQVYLWASTAATITPVTGQFFAVSI